jgi:hypothetical protein
LRGPHHRRLGFESLEDRHLLATITVNSLQDNGSGGTTLREAVAAANSGDTIVFAASLFSGGPATIQLVDQPSSDPDHIRVERNMTIQGPGANQLTIRAYDPSPTSDNNDGGRIFNIGDGSQSFISVTISGMTLTGGDPVLTDTQTGSGGAIRNMENLTILNCVISDSYTSNGGAVSNASGAGTLTITDSIISGNSADDGGGLFVESGSANITRTRFEGNYAQNVGGAIINRGFPITITDSTFIDNGAGNPESPLEFNGAGGAIATYGSTLTISGTTITGNDVGNQGGAIFNENSAVTISNSTISGNSADHEGGAIYNKYTTGASFTIRHSTITGNSAGASDSGGGIFSGAGATSPVLNHTIVAGNVRGTSTPDDLAGSFSAQFSLIGLKGSATITDIPPGGNQIGIASAINAMLGPLANNGGLTMTHALLSGSPAIDTGNAAAVAGSGNVPLFDQRGTPFGRIVDGDNAGGARIDIGAFELVFVNNPPTNPSAVNLAAINEDVPGASNSGSLVSAIVSASGSTDPDGNTVGIAVTAADNANGQWEYSTNAGGSWSNLSSLTAAAARLLAPAHLVRFVPNANFNSQIAASPTITFKAWDQTSGTAGATGDTTSGTAYSAASASVTQPVTAVNDAPSFALSASSAQSNEDAGAVTVNGFATNIARGPAAATDEAAQVLTFVVNVTGTTGNLAFTSAPAIDPATGALTYTMAANTNGSATVDVVLQDNGSGTSPNVNASAAQTFSINVTAVNDAPSFTLSGSSVQSNEDAGAVTINGFATSIARGPASATDEATQGLTFAVNVTGTTGNLSFTAAPSINATTGALTFTLSGNTDGTATVQVVLQDDGSGTPPNVNSSAAQNFTIEVAAVNDEQVLAANTGLTLNRGSSALITTSMLETTDIDDAPADLVYTVTTAPTHGTLLVSGSPVSQFTQQQLSAGLVSYQHDGTATLSDSFGFTVDDGEGTSSPGTFSISVSPFAGDYNGDGTVGAGDYVLWRKTLSTPASPQYAGADGDGSGTIDAPDYTVWRENFGDVLTPGAGSGMQLGGATEQPAASASSGADGSGAGAAFALLFRPSNDEARPVRNLGRATQVGEADAASDLLLAIESSSRGAGEFSEWANSGSDDASAVDTAMEDEGFAAVAGALDFTANL